MLFKFGCLNFTTNFFPVLDECFFFFFCWLAAWEHSYRWTPWPLNHFVVIALYQQQLFYPYFHYLTPFALLFDKFSSHYIFSDGLSHYRDNNIHQLYSKNHRNNIFFTIFENTLIKLSTDMFKQRCQSFWMHVKNKTGMTFLFFAESKHF